MSRRTRQRKAHRRERLIRQVIRRLHAQKVIAEALQKPLLEHMFRDGLFPHMLFQSPQEPSHG